MIKSRYFVFIGVIIAVMLFISGNLATPVQANTAGTGTPTSTSTPIVNLTDVPGVPASAEEQEELKSIVQSYVEIRYQALSVSNTYDFQQNGFDSLIAETDEAKIFLKEEMGKLAVQIKHVQLNNIRYTNYKVTLDFHSITVDPDTQTAFILVSERNEVIYELSAKANPEDPIVSESAGIEHTITLHKEQDQWKIVSDTYNDDIWKMLRKTGKSTDEILLTMDTAPTPEVERNQAEITATVSDDPSSHFYNRTLAVEYALRHWDSLAGQYNPNYTAYPKDCQNFVSQAIYEGGNASMFIPDPLPAPSLDGQQGWYYLSDLQRASAWNDVDQFYTFVTGAAWSEPYPGGEWYGQGPQGSDVSINELMLGDVIQYDWGQDGFWDHSAIVVDFVDNIPYVASHTADHGHADYRLLPDTNYRFIHIEQSNGYPPVKVQTIYPSDDAGGNPGGSCPVTNYDSGNNYLGDCFDVPGGVTSGFLFRDIQIPRGARIKYAYVTFTTDGTYVPIAGTPGVLAPIALQIGGENSVSAADFSTLYPPPAYRTPFPNLVTWHIDATASTADYDTWYPGGKRATPNIRDVIQAVTDQSGWVPGNELSLLFLNGSDSHFARRVTAYEVLQNPAGLNPARLIVAYDLDLSSPPAYTSSGAQDGMILESRETSGVGRDVDSTSMVFHVGDDASDKQYRGILHFDTSSLPDNAIVTSAVLKIKQLSVSGTDPFTTHGPLNVDIKSGAFSNNPALAKGDFEAAADRVQAAAFNSTPTDGWYTAALSIEALSYVSLTSSTQLRLGFQLDDNDDMGADFMVFISGNDTTVANRPQLIITYYIPTP